MCANFRGSAWSGSAIMRLRAAHPASVKNRRGAGQRSSRINPRASRVRPAGGILGSPALGPVFLVFRRNPSDATGRVVNTSCNSRRMYARSAAVKSAVGPAGVVGMVGNQSPFVARFGGWRRSRCCDTLAGAHATRSAATRQALWDFLTIGNLLDGRATPISPVRKSHTARYSASARRRFPPPGIFRPAGDTL